MFHKNAVTPIRSSATSAVRAQESISFPQPVQLSTPRLSLVPSAAAGGRGTPEQSSSALIDLISVSAHRCSSFFAEAAVLVLVLAVLDRFMLKGRIEMGWIISAFSISVALLAASIATDFTARRWLRHH
jgi:hypothetical protein